MLSVRIFWLLLCFFWVAAEFKLAKRRPIDATQLSDKEEHSQKILWLTIIASLIVAWVFKSLAIAPIPIGYLLRQFLALVIFMAGLGLRFSAVKQLGGFFTTNVAIQHEHALITDGLYRHIRHPAYTGLIIAFFGAGLAMGDFIALILLTIPLLFAINYRIAIEEKLLLNKFGAGYQDYISTTNKLFPGI